ncbi:protein kinase activating protein dpb11 [Saxophila tyrrhenica]|uniref:Protein kinase activating protein dpb11 n=1 Tax=Saxophila tyrrhenica TaxID=1690608 RepID=A0AAV9P591_9PEZI|nr:protein kinase activating protein dpb11 [Saxophila tyrrhenica]
MAQDMDHGIDPLPLKGVVLCCTSLLQDARIKLAETAQEMGAIHKLDLTADVTHLIVGSITTPKYCYVAKERPDIKVLHPDWIEAVRVPWMDGQDVDVPSLEWQHQLRTFHNLQICVTGFEEQEERNAIAAKVISEGATYHGDLTKVVTHLIAAVPQGKKYVAARSWGIKVVSQKWYEDSLSRGMALDESLYDPVMPVEEQGIGAFRLQPRARTSLGKRGRDGEAEGSTEATRKKLRRTTSTRLESQSQDMWQDISAHSVGVETSGVDQWTDHDDRSTTRDTGESSMTVTSMTEPPHRHREVSEGLFSGIYIFLYGFDAKRTQRLHEFLDPNCARIVKSLTEFENASTNPFFKQRYLLVPYDGNPAKLQLPPVPAATQTATEWWVERSISHKRVLDPNDDVLSAPLWMIGPSAFKDMRVSTTGFSGLDLRQIAKAVDLLGGTYWQTLQSFSTVLICATDSIKKEKAFYAQKHNIPVVSADWLWTCLKTSKQPPFDKYAIALPAYDPASMGGESSYTGSPAPSEAQKPIRKDEQMSKRLSNTRKKQATPSLPLQAARSSHQSAAQKPQPFVHEDEDDDQSLDSAPPPPLAPRESLRRASQPLQELSPNRSPRKTSQTSRIETEEDKVEPNNHLKVEPPSEDSHTLPQPPTSDTMVNGHAPARPRPSLDADISDLLQHRSAGSRPNSTSDLQKRKNRPLGRAPSGISNRSMSASNQSGGLSPVHQSDETADLPEEVRNSTCEVPLPPSTQLGYETAEAEQHRLQMSKRMGTKLEDEGGLRRLANVGTVKDSASIADAGVGNRVRGRHRAK